MKRALEQMEFRLSTQSNQILGLQTENLSLKDRIHSASTTPGGGVSGGGQQLGERRPSFSPSTSAGSGAHSYTGLAEFGKGSYQGRTNGAGGTGGGGGGGGGYSTFPPPRFQGPMPFDRPHEGGTGMGFSGAFGAGAGVGLGRECRTEPSTPDLGVERVGVRCAMGVLDEVGPPLPALPPQSEGTRTLTRELRWNRLWKGSAGEPSIEVVQRILSQSFSYSLVRLSFLLQREMRSRKHALKIFGRGCFLCRSSRRTTGR